MKIEDFSRELENMCAKDEATTIQLLAKWLHKKDLLGYLLQQFSTANMVKALNGRVNFGEIFGHLIDVIEREGIIDFYRDRIGMKEDVKVSSEALQKLPENAIVVEQDRNVFRVVGRTRNTLLVESDTTKNRYIVDGDDVILAAPVTVK